MKLWKVVGLAGMAGVAATGAAVARSERRRRAYQPDEVRSRLLERHAEAVRVETVRVEAAPLGTAGDPNGDRPPGYRKGPWSRLSISRWRRWPGHDGT